MSMKNMKNKQNRFRYDIIRQVILRPVDKCCKISYNTSTFCITDGIAEHRKGVQKLNADRLGNPVFQDCPFCCIF